MKIYKYLDQEAPQSRFIEIEIENKRTGDSFTITLTKKEVDIECCIEGGYTSGGTAGMYMNLEDLEALIKEVKES